MSRTLRSHLLLAFALSGVLGWASLAAPARAHAQTVSPERALLNNVDAFSSIAVSPDAPRSWQGDPPASRVVDGKRALLGRSQAPKRDVFDPSEVGITSLEEVRHVDGEQALLGKWALSATPDRAISAASK